MGYTTEFSGQIAIVPPLSEEERAFLTKFSQTRRMLRGNGPYFVDGAGFGGQNHDPDILNYNAPPEGQPGLWCQWIPNEEGTALVWDEGEKFYAADEWMEYLIDHFLKPDHLAPMPFLGAHTLNGEILAQGEDIHDRWQLIVEDNLVSRVKLA